VKAPFLLTAFCRFTLPFSILLQKRREIMILFPGDHSSEKEWTSIKMVLFIILKLYSILGGPTVLDSANHISRNDLEMK